MMLSDAAPVASASVGPTSSSQQPAPSAAALDLRHVTSASNLSPRMKDRTVSASSDKSARLSTTGANLMSVSPPGHRVGSRSPTSIPSSPTSVHSSSSAIFERDIEPSPNQLHPHSSHPSNPHRTPRSKATEPIDTAVPSVLSSAATLLTSTDNESLVAIEAPVSIASAIGSPVNFGSRSPSPSRSTNARTSMLLNLPSPTQMSTVSPAPLSPVSNASSGGEPAKPLSPQQADSKTASPKGLSLTTSLSAGTPLGEPAMPGGFTPSAATVLQNGSGKETPSSVDAASRYESAASSPTTTTREHPPHPLPTDTSPAMTPTATSFDSSAQAVPRPRQQQQASHPPSPSNAAKRLSFLSYADMINSTPISTLPLSSLTSPASSIPPPHIPSVEFSVGSASPSVGSGSRSVSAAASARTSLLLDGYSPVHLQHPINHVHSGLATDVKEPTGGVGDDLGGEWAREGLGRGLEERLETLLGEKAA